MQGATNKDLFVCRPNVFRIRRNHLWFKGAYGHFQFIMQISVATIVPKLPWYDYWINIFCAILLYSILTHLWHQLCLKKGHAYFHSLFWTLCSLGQSWYQVVLAREGTHGYYFRRCTPAPAAGGNLSKKSVLANSPNRWQCQCHSSVSSLSWACQGWNFCLWPDKHSQTHWGSELDLFKLCGKAQTFLKSSGCLFGDAHMGVQLSSGLKPSAATRRGRRVFIDLGALRRNMSIRMHNVH